MKLPLHVVFFDIILLNRDGGMEANMAIWQFDCYIIPKENVTANICLEGDEIFIWGRQSVPIEKIDFLEQQKSWSEKIFQYGKADETCIEFFYEKDILMEIYCRLDLRSLSKKSWRKY